jgi:putative transposase
VQVRRELGVSERRACSVLGQSRSTQRHEPRVKDDEAALRQRIVELACEYGRYGYRRITALLRQEGWRVNRKRVGRIWRQEGLKVPGKQPKRGRRVNHVWSYDFVHDRTYSGRAYRLLTVLDEWPRECLAIEADRQLNSERVLACLVRLFVERGVPDYIRSDNGAEFTAHAVRDWLGRVGVRTLFIEPGSPWENGYIESFNGKLRDELLNGEIFYTLKEAQVLIERWRRHYNEVRPHSALGYRPPAPEALEPKPLRLAGGLTLGVVQ